MMRKKMGDKGLLSDDTRELVQFSENKMVYKAHNKNGRRVLMYAVDGEMLNEATKKCDKALGVPDTGEVYLIELKGRDLKKATEQIFETMQVLGKNIKDFIIHGRIVCTKIPRPDLRSTQFVKLERELAKGKGTLIKQSRIIEENI